MAKLVEFRPVILEKIVLRTDEQTDGRTGEYIPVVFFFFFFFFFFLSVGTTVKTRLVAH